MIIRYDNNVKKLVKAKTEPQPWLHIALCGNNKRTRNNVERGYSWAIYVWDTRECLESGWVPTDQLMLEDTFRGFKHALDNLQPLTGNLDANAQFVSRAIRQRI